ncbi:MAG TPA: PEP_CTERM-anchored TLD domain-containing protein [Opitutaceae bacterium]|nr:PEP_CTERM-anchored TLD domain-containing protein [Opitutaceae bacterium]
MKSIAFCLSLSVFGLVASVLPLRAQLLNDASETQLVTWINQGPLTFTHDFTKVAGDGQNALDFHAASDEKGPTVSLFDVTPFDTADDQFDLPDQVIAGGIPASWYSTNTWNIISDPINQSAMLFNLTDGFVEHENVSTFSGMFQSLNSPLFGPTFGLGDLVTDFDLEHGIAIHSSYGGISPYAPNILGVVGLSASDLFKVNRLEVYSVALNPSTGDIPEPAGYGLCVAVAAAAVVLLRHRKSRTALATLHAV